MSHPIDPTYLAAGKRAADQMMEAAFGRPPAAPEAARELARMDAEGNPCTCGDPSAKPVMTWQPPVVSGPLTPGPGLAGALVSDQDLGSAAEKIRGLSGARLAPTVAERLAVLLEAIDRVPEPHRIDVIQVVVDARYLARAVNAIDPNHWANWATDSDRRRLAAEIKAWRDKNDFARSPDWWQAIDAVLDIIEPGEGG